MTSHRTLILSLRRVLLVLICAGAAPMQVQAQAQIQMQIPKSDRLPSTRLPARGLDSITIEPTINQMVPRAPTIAIGEAPVSVRLEGSQLGQIAAVQVVDSVGTPQPHIQAHIVAGGRTGNALPLQLFARKNARPGRYRLQVMLVADPRQVDDRPQGAPLGGRVGRTLPVPESSASITVRSMEPKITSMMPPAPSHSTPVMPRFIVSDVPGSEILSVGRSSKLMEGDCAYEPGPATPAPLPHYVGSIGGQSWSAPNTLGVTLVIGEFGARSPCKIRLTIRTRNVLGEEFYVVPPPFTVNLKPPPSPPKLPVSSTWALKNHLHLPATISVGVCSGHSLGAHGAIPVGIVNVNGNLGFRARSGPIGTDCWWNVATERLKQGWSLYMKFRVRHIGNKCRTGGSAADHPKLRAATIRGDREVSLSSNLSMNGNALWLVYLECDPTLSNDHEVLVEMVSASVSPTQGSVPAGCDWRCAFR